MKVGDLVKFKDVHAQTVIDDFGLGLLTAVYPYEKSVEVLWTNISYSTRTIECAFLEVINESNSN